MRTILTMAAAAAMATSGAAMAQTMTPQSGAAQHGHHAKKGKTAHDDMATLPAPDASAPNAPADGSATMPMTTPSGTTTATPATPAGDGAMTNDPNTMSDPTMGDPATSPQTPEPTPSGTTPATPASPSPR